MQHVDYEIVFFGPQVHKARPLKTHCTSGFCTAAVNAICSFNTFLTWRKDHQHFVHCHCVLSLDCQCTETQVTEMMVDTQRKAGVSGTIRMQLNRP